MEQHVTFVQKDSQNNICILRFNVLNEITAIFNNDSNYDNHFIIKEPENEFDEQFECLGEKK